LSGSTGNPATNGKRAAAVQRLKTAVAERKQAREEREASKRGQDATAPPAPVKNRT